MGWKKRITGQLGNHTFQASLPWCCAEAVFFSHMQHYMCHMQLITAALHFKLWNLKHPFFLLFFLFLFLLFFYYKLKCHKRASHNLNVGVFVLFFCFLNLFTFFWVVFGLCSLLTQGRISRGRTAVCLCSYSLQSSTLKKKKECLCFRNAHLKRWIVDHFIIFLFFYFFLDVEELWHIRSCWTTTVCLLLEDSSKNILLFSTATELQGNATQFKSPCILLLWLS